METKIQNVVNSMRIKDNKALITYNTDIKLKDLYLDLIYSQNIGGNIETGYNLCYEAKCFFEDETSETIDELQESLEGYYDFASVYDSELQSYLNINNEQEIAETMKEYNLDSISQACAIWFENKVREIIGIIIEEYIK